MDTIELSSAQLCNANNSFSIFVVVVVCFGYPREIQKVAKLEKSNLEVAFYIFVVQYALIINYSIVF